MKKVLVTGGNGYIGTHVVKLLLDNGYEVHATVRNLNSTIKNQGLDTLKSQYPDRLRIFAADLLNAGSFTESMQGCDTVMHIASPFLLPETIKDGQKQVVDPALIGTRNVLDSVNLTPSVVKVVLTSSIAAVLGDNIEAQAMPNNTISEVYFNQTSTVENNPYLYAKTQAELLAWDMANGQDRWKLVVINPALVLGPTLTKSSDSGSLLLLNQLIKGYFFYGAANFYFATVDVREVALAHVRAAENPQAQGRYLIAHAEMISMLDMANALRAVHAKPWLLPRWTLPDGFVRVAGGLFGLSPQYLQNNLGISYHVDHHRSQVDLGIQYRPITKTLCDHYQSWVS